MLLYLCRSYSHTNWDSCEFHFTYEIPISGRTSYRTTFEYNDWMPKLFMIHQQQADKIQSLKNDFQKKLAFNNVLELNSELKI